MQSPKTPIKMTEIPKSPKDVTKNWLKTVLQKSLNETIEVQTLNIVTQKNGFLCGTFKAQVLINGQLVKLFIKTMLETDDPLRYMWDDFEFDRIEISTYNTFFPELIKFEREQLHGKSELETMLPKVYAADYCLSKDNRGFYLIMEDISADFQLIATEEGLSHLQISKALEKLARFHAIGYAFTKNNLTIVEGWKLESEYPFVSDFKRVDYPSIVEAIGKVESRLKEPVEQICKQWWDICQEMYFFEEKRFLTHSDCWLNNMFFSFDDCKFLDWQVFMLGHPAMDLAYLLGTSLTPEHLDEWMDDLLNMYFDKFQSTCEKINGIVSPMTRDDFKNTFHTKGLMSMTGMFIIGWNELTVLPGMKPRAIKVISLAVENNPQYFK